MDQYEYLLSKTARYDFFQSRRKASSFGVELIEKVFRGGPNEVQGEKTTDTVHGSERVTMVQDGCIRIIGS